MLKINLGNKMGYCKMIIKTRNRNKISAKVISVNGKTLVVEVPIQVTSPKEGENIIVTVPSERKKLVGMGKASVQLSDVITRGIVTKVVPVRTGNEVAIKMNNQNEPGRFLKLKQIKDRNASVNIRAIGITPEVQ